LDLFFSDEENRESRRREKGSKTKAQRWKRPPLWNFLKREGKKDGKRKTDKEYDSDFPEPRVQNLPQWRQRG